MTIHLFLSSWKHAESKNKKRLNQKNDNLKLFEIIGV